MIVGQLHRQCIAGGQRDHTEVGLDAPGIADARPEQRDIAAVRCVNRTVIADGASSVAREMVIASHKVAVADIARGRDQRADVDRGAAAEHDPVGIDQEDLAVGTEIAQDHGRIGTENAVERHRLAARLHKAHAVASANVEALPVDHHVGAGLVDQHAGGGGIDLGAAERDHAAGRLLRVQIGRAGERDRRGHDAQGQARAAVDAGGMLLVKGVHVFPCVQVQQNQKYLTAWIQKRPDLSGADVAVSLPSLRA